MNQRIRGTLLAAAVVGGGVLGATGLSSVALAREGDREQDQPAVAVQTDGDEQTPEAGRGRRGGGCHLDAAAEAIGISEDELRGELEGGATIAAVAEEHGVSTDDVVSAMLAEAREHLDEEVASGELSQEEADERLADKQERVEERVTSPFEPRERGERPARPEQSGGTEAEPEDAS